MKLERRDEGFTLVEALLSVALLALVASNDWGIIHTRAPVSGRAA